MFEIAPLNPISFIQPGKESFFGKSALDFINGFQTKVCYFQKWQTNDKTRVQVLTAFDFTFKIRRIEDDVEVLDILPEIMPTVIVSEAFQVKEVEVDFSLLPEDYYYAEVSYEDENEALTTLVSEPFEVKELHENTLLFKYSNSENNFSVIFANDLEFNLRIEGVIADFNPESDDVIYNDIAKNSTLLDSIPYLSFTLYLGNAEGLPAYMADKINRAMACDIVAIDGDHYAKKEGAAWETVRADEYPFVGLNIEIQLVENRFVKSYKTGTDADLNDVVPMQKLRNFQNVANSLTVPNVFKAFSLLEKIAIIKTGGAFEYRVGLTPGGSEVGTFQVFDTADTQTINYLFTSGQTLYISGLGNVAFLSLIWKQLDERPIRPEDFGEGGTPGAGSTPVGGMVIYSPQNNDELLENFNLTAGLGRENTPWFGWAICDGRNGTVDMGGRFPVGYKPGEYELNATGGADEVTLTLAQIPEHSHGYINNSDTANGFRRSVGTGARNFKSPQQEQTTSQGGGQAHENRPPFRAVLWVAKIF